VASSLGVEHLFYNEYYYRPNIRVGNQDWISKMASVFGYILQECYIEGFRYRTERRENPDLVKALVINPKLDTNTIEKLIPYHSHFLELPFKKNFICNPFTYDLAIKFNVDSDDMTKGRSIFGIKITHLKRTLYASNRSFIYEDFAEPLKWFNNHQLVFNAILYYMMILVAYEKCLTGQNSGELYDIWNMVCVRIVQDAAFYVMSVHDCPIENVDPYEVIQELGSSFWNVLQHEGQLDHVYPSDVSLEEIWDYFDESM
jgi:hypothetical protein